MTYQGKARKLVIGSLAAVGSLLCAPADAGFFSHPDNYAECILDRLQDVQNDQVALSETVECQKQFPGSPTPEKIRPILFGPRTIADCVAEYGGGTHSGYAADQIRTACFQLYPETLDGD